MDSGREDSNLRLLDPQSSALTGLRYAPCVGRLGDPPRILAMPADPTSGYEPTRIARPNPDPRLDAATRLNAGMVPRVCLLEQERRADDVLTEPRRSRLRRRSKARRSSLAHH